MHALEPIIERAWQNRELLKDAETIAAIKEVVDLCDQGILRCAAPTDNGWQVNEWVKKAIILYFPIQHMHTYEVGIFEYHDKIPLKTGYAAKGVRVVPHAIARHGAFLAKGVILMPSYVNIGAYVDQGTMVDTWATVGSCAQIGKNVHLSGGVGIGGVLEPLQAAPVIVEDDVFIGSGVELIAPIEVEKGATVGAGSTISRSAEAGKLTVERGSRKTLDGWKRPTKKST